MVYMYDCKYAHIRSGPIVADVLRCIICEQFILQCAGEIDKVLIRAFIPRVFTVYTWLKHYGQCNSPGHCYQCMWCMILIAVFKGTACRDLRGIKKLQHQSIGRPLKNRRFALDYNFKRLPSWKLGETIQHKLIRNY